MFDPEATASVWWAQARSDMVSARALRGIGHYAAACFHAQQAGEKAAKAFLILTGDRRVEGHSVGVLVARASARDARFNPVQADAAFLDRFYIQTRYPDAWPGGVVPAEQYHDPEAQSALAAAERLMAVVEEILREQAGQEGNGQQHP